MLEPVDDEPELEPIDEPEEEPVDEASSIVKLEALVADIEFQVKQAKRRIWRAFIRVQEPLEDSMRQRYVRWATAERRETLARFDEITRIGAAEIAKQETVGSINLIGVLPTPATSSRNLRTRVRPLFLGMLEETWEFTASQFGTLPVFEIDDPRIMRVFETREAKFVSNVPSTVRKNLMTSLTTGINQGETLGQLRNRVQEVYGAAITPAKALTVARTETAGFMNTVRREMHKAQGFSNKEWADADDENTRPHHEVFGSAGVQEMEFNWLELVNASGTLLHPHDPEAPANEVVNCRCVEIPA